MPAGGGGGGGYGARRIKASGTTKNRPRSMGVALRNIGPYI